jgi:hypothetical protein
MYCLRRYTYNLICPQTGWNVTFFDGDNLQLALSPQNKTPIARMRTPYINFGDDPGSFLGHIAVPIRNRPLVTQAFGSIEINKRANVSFGANIDDGGLLVVDGTRNVTLPFGRSYHTVCSFFTKILFFDSSAVSHERQSFF